MALLASVLLASPLAAFADEADIRKSLADNYPQIPKIDEIKPAAMPGLFEVRLNGSEIIYTDAKGNFIIQGNLIDVKQRRDLTAERMNQLSAIKFDDLPLKDAFTVVRGNGKRKVAVFEDPNCGYCKQFEANLQKVDNITVYMFLYPILSPDSTEKSKNIWCANDKTKAWMDWMLRDQPIAAASCDTAAISRNIEFGKKYKITGTPTLVFADGARIPGAINAQQIEKKFAEIH